MQLHTECDDCISLLQHATTIISQSASRPESSSSQFIWVLSYDKQYQTRLLANAASSKCYMCALLHRHIPRLSESHAFGKELGIVVKIARYDPLAANIVLMNKDGASYASLLRVHEGEMWRILGYIRDNC